MKKLLTSTALCFLMAGFFSSCGNNSESKNETSDSATTTTNTTDMNKPGIHQTDWGETDGKKVHLFTLVNNNGVQIKISDYGGTITSWVAPDSKGNKSNIVLGFDALTGYTTKPTPPYFGATIGRYGNRIGDAKFSLEGNTYTLAANNGKNHLHGGEKGFDKVVWEAAPLTEGTPSLTLNYTSIDGEEGYPGNLKVSVKFTLSDENELTIEYNAEADKATPINLTNHSYFNLTGDITKPILDHSLTIDADRYTPVDTTAIPTGELAPVKGTPFDFNKTHKIGERIEKVPGPQPGGYDHNWVLNKKGNDVQLAATLSEETSGRKLEVYTAEPGLQFYSGNFLDGSLKSSAGQPFNKHAGLCLETQHFPDSPNKPAFPNTILKPGEKYHTTTRYKLVVNK